MSGRRQILRNRARCSACGDVIESKFRHDWVQCSCKGVFVDGGLDYLRRGYGDGVSFEELSEHAPAGPIVISPDGEIEQ